jgi:hypothetical protein
MKHESEISVFRWETLREIGPDLLPFAKPVHGFELEVELISGSRVHVFRAEDGRFYFCHGLTFGGKDAPGGAVSPYSGKAVTTILAELYDLVAPESAATAGDVVVWHDLSRRPVHTAVLLKPIVMQGDNRLDYASLLRSKNGNQLESDTTLEQLAASDDGYGESYAVYRRRLPKE